MIIKKMVWFIFGFVSGLVLINSINFFSDMFFAQSQENAVVTQEMSVSTQGEKATTTVAGVTSDNATEKKLHTTDIITAYDQVAGDTVIVTKTSLPTDGWLVVHEENDGVISNALGAVRRDTGEYADVIIKLLRPTIAGQTYWVILYQDNGDRVFDLQTDFPLRTESNELEMVSFNAQ